jgi:hypothetical protein
MIHPPNENDDHDRDHHDQENARPNGPIRESANCLGILNSEFEFLAGHA